ELRALPGVDGARHAEPADAVVVRYFELRRHVEAVAGFPQRADAEQLQLVARVVAARGEILDIAFLILEPRRDAQAQRVADRAGDVAGQVIAFEVEIIGAGDAALERRGRTGADDADRARRRVLAIERALRAAHHLDARDVEEGVERLAHLAGIDAVHIDADRLVERKILRRRAEAADIDGVVAVGLLHEDVGDVILHRL